jgi:hypothetical protein
MDVRVDRVSLIGGLVVAALGGTLLIDFGGSAELGWGWFLPLAAAAVGTLLLLWGLAARGEGGGGRAGMPGAGGGRAGGARR